MKSALTALVFALMLTAAATDPAVDLEAAIRRETVRGDLKTAAETYRKIAGRKDAPREVAARALLRLALVYRKQGDAQARATLERVLRDYADQTKTADEARAELAGMAGPSGSSEGVIWKGPASQWLKGNGHVSADGETFAGRKDIGGVPNLALGKWRTGEVIGLTPLEGICSLSLVSPDGTRVAYSHGRGGCREIRVVSPGARGPDTVFSVDPPRFVRLAAWMPDSVGAVVLVGSINPQERNVTEVIIVDVLRRSTHLVRKLAATVEPVKTPANGYPDWAYHAAVSPDGKWIALDIGEMAPRVLAMAGDFDEPLAGAAYPDQVVAWASGSKHLLIQRDLPVSAGYSKTFHRFPMREGRASGPSSPAGLMNYGITLGADAQGVLYFEEWSQRIDAYTISLDTAAAALPRRVTNQFDGHTAAPLWSPDGSKLAWFVTRGMEANNPALIRLFVRDLRSGTESEVKLQIPIHLRPSPSWLTGGQGIMAGWNAPSRTGPGGALHAIDPVTGVDRKLYSFESQSARDPLWTADGKKLYHHRVSAPVITVMDTSGVVSEIFRDTPATGIRDVTPSPDGKTLAYISMSGMENHAIKLLDLATGTAKELVGNIRPSYLRRCLAWTPDGRTIIYSTESRPLSKLWIVSTEGGQPRQLGPDFDGRLFELTVSPDGRQLGFDWSRTSIELWRKEVFPR